jgi:hypothetical protein
VLLDLPIAALAGETPCYCLRIGGALDPARAAWFDGLAVLPWGEATLLAGPIPDQPALFGLLARIRDLGLPLVELRLLPSGPAELLALLLAG